MSELSSDVALERGVPQNLNMYAVEVQTLHHLDARQESVLPWRQPDTPRVCVYHTLLSMVFKRVIVTPAVYPRVGESRHIDIQSTGQKSVCDIHHLDASQTYVLIIQLDSPP